MFSIAVVFGDGQHQSWGFMFKEKGRAQEAFDALTAARIKFVSSSEEELVTIQDDFGQTANVLVSTITGALLEDLKLSGGAAIERGIQNMRNQSKAQQLANADPTLRAVMLMDGNGAGHPFARHG